MSTGSLGCLDVDCPLRRYVQYVGERPLESLAQDLKYSGKGKCLSAVQRATVTLNVALYEQLFNSSRSGENCRPDPSVDDGSGVWEETAEYHQGLPSGP